MGMDKVKVLFLAANPLGTDRLKLDEEIRAITEKVYASEYRDFLHIESSFSTLSTYFEDTREEMTDEEESIYDAYYENALTRVEFSQPDSFENVNYPCGLDSFEIWMKWIDTEVGPKVLGLDYFENFYLDNLFKLQWSKNEMMKRNLSIST